MDFGILSSGLGGIITGLVGPIAKGIIGLKQQKAEFDHEEKMVKAESNAAIAEAEAEIKKIETKTQGKVAIAETQAMSGALKDATKSVFGADYMKYLADSGQAGRIIAAVIAALLGMVEALRRSIRPVVTLYMIGVTTWVTWLAYQVLEATEGAISGEFAQELFRMVIYTCVYLTVAIINFWFVNREKGLIKKIAKKI